MGKIIYKSKYDDTTIRKDYYAIESNEREKSRQWAIKKLQEIKDKENGKRN